MQVDAVAAPRRGSIELPRLEARRRADDAGLELADHLLELGRFPFLGLALPSAVEPHQVDLTVVGEQLANLSEHYFDKAIPCLGRRAPPLAPSIWFVGLGKCRVIRVIP